MASSGVHPSSKGEIQYTDVVIIGNGPSGISLSYMLAGHTPYYMGSGHTNEYLHWRLMDGKGASLYEQDLEYLSSGLEGRSSSPVALLFDALTHPDADMGIENKSLLEWHLQPDKAIPHIVLGRCKPGGVWQSMDGTMETLSMGSWMQLPDLPFRDWLNQHHAACQNRPVHLKQDRASMQDVRLYYEDYVKTKGLSHYFRPGTIVTTVERVLDVCHSIDSESGEQLPCSHSHHGKHKWEVRGYETYEDEYTGETVTKDFCYRAPHVVLATGSTDNPNQLRVPGENQPYVFYTLRQLEDEIQAGNITPSSDPVLVVGTGLSAADAILYMRAQGIPVAHIFRRGADDPGVIYRKLPAILYPEYHRVYAWMTAGSDGHEGGYSSYPSHNVVECKEGGRVLIRGADIGCDTLIKASAVLVQIGARPDLSFLPHSGRHLGVMQDLPIESKHNPVAVDLFSYQSVHEYGLYAMGPLVGDNFLRFLRGGALAITAHLWRKRNGDL